MAVFPAVGLLLLYGYWPLTYFYGTYNRTLFFHNPDTVGFKGIYDFVYQMIGYCAIFLLFDLVMLVVGVSGGQLGEFSRWSIRLVCGTFLVVIVLFCFDPGGYLSWFLD